MSFGGGTTQYILEYIVKVTNQGGAATSGPLNQLNASTQQVTQSTTQLTASQEKLRVAHERVTQAGLGVSKAAKGMAFGFIGIATAGAEAVGMLSMYQQTQAAVTEAQKAQDVALKEGGKNTKDYKDATNELVKAQRWQRMTQRNLMLSLFDLVPFIVLSINGILKLRTALKMAAEAKAAENAIRALGVSMKGTAVASGALNATAATSGITLSKFGKGAVLASSGQMKFSAATIKSTAAFGAADAAMISGAISAGKAEKSVTGLAKAMRVLSIAMKIAIPLVILEIASQAFQNNWGGFADKVNALGLAFGNAVPAAKGFLDIIGKVGRSIVAVFTGNFEDIGKIWATTQEKLGDTGPTEKQTKAAEEHLKVMQEINTTVADFAQEMSQMKWGDLKKSLKGIGFGEGARKAIKIGLKFAVEKPTEAVQHLIDGLNFVKMFHLSPSTQASMVGNVYDDIKRAIKKTKGQGFLPKDVSPLDFMKPLLKVLDKYKSSPELPNKVAEIVQGMTDAEKKAFEQATGMTTDEFIKALGLDPAAVSKVVTAAKKTTDQLQEDVWNNAFAQPAVHQEFLNGEKVGKSWMDSPMMTEVQNMINGVQKAIDDADWVGMGNSLRAGLASVFNAKNLNQFGATLRNYIFVPIVTTALGIGQIIKTAMGPWIKEFQTDPLSALGGAAVQQGDREGDFLAGLFGFPTRVDFYNAIVLFFSDVKDQIDAAIRTNLANFDIKAAENQPGSGGMSGGTEWDSFITTWVQPIFDIATWGRIISNIASGKFFTDLKVTLNSLMGVGLAGIGDVKGNELGSGSGGMSGGSAWDSWMITWIQPIFDINTWGRILANIASGKFFTDLKSLLDSLMGVGMASITGGKDTKEAGSGGMSGGSTWDAWMTTWVQPIFDIATWGRIIQNIGSGKFFTDLWAVINGLFKVGMIPSTGPMSTGFDSNVAGSGGMSSGNTAVDSWVEKWLQPFFKLETWQRIGKRLWDALGGIGKIITDIVKGNTAEGIMVDQKGVLVTVTADTSPADIAFSKFVNNNAKKFSNLSTHWNSMVVNMAKASSKGANIIAKNIGSGMTKSGKAMSNLSSHWNDMALNMAKASSTAANKIAKNIGSGMTKAGKAMSNLSSHWNDMCNNMVSAAKNAASQINSAIQGIKDKVVHVTVERGGALAKGGLMSFAEGGMISAARGRLLTTSGPQVYTIGDNPGGKESVWAIPHNNPFPTMNKIDAFYGRGSRSGSGDTTLNQNVVLHISGNDIINEMKLNKKIKFTMGDSMDRFG